MRSLFRNYIGDNSNANNQLEMPIIEDELDKECVCIPTELRFASNGKVYNCEIGTRSKDTKYYTGISLWEGIPEIKPFECKIKKECFSNFKGENTYKLIE